MAERTIVGVDFSGAGEDTDVGKTWMTEGVIETEETGELKRGMTILESCKSVSREGLAEKLKALPGDAVVALDFPFSVPIAFAEHLGHCGSEMPELWQSVAPMKFDEFKDAAAGFTDLLRSGDLHCSNAKPSLKMAGNPVMVNMTYKGMQMLHSLRQEGCRVPPLDDTESTGATLLEVMPGAALKALDLPYERYKNGGTAFENRQKILRGLRRISEVHVLNLSDYHEHAMFSDDALDSIVAAVVASLWTVDESENAFAIPRKAHTVYAAFANYKGNRRISPGIEHLTEVEAGRKEGWIYVPKKQLPCQMP